MKLVVNIIIGLLVLSAVFFGVKFLMGDKEPAGTTVTTRPVATTGGATAPGTIRTDDFLALLNAAESISFESALFTDDVFLGLYDFQQPLPERPVGRVNPFAPFNQNETETVKATTTKKITP